MRTSDAHRREARLMQWLLQSFFTQQQYSVQSKPWTEWGHRWLSTIWELCHNVPYTKMIFTTRKHLPSFSQVCTLLVWANAYICVFFSDTITMAMQSVWQSISLTTLNLKVIWGHTLVINHNNGTWHSCLVVILQSIWWHTLGIDHIYVANVKRPHGGAILRWHTPGRNLINVASVVRLSQRLEVFLVFGFVIVFFIIISNVWVVSKIGCKIVIFIFRC